MPDLPQYLTRPSNAATIAERKRLAIATITTAISIPSKPSKAAPGPSVPSVPSRAAKATSSNTVPLGPKRVPTNTGEAISGPSSVAGLAVTVEASVHLPARPAPPSKTKKRKSKGEGTPAPKNAKAQLPPKKPKVAKASPPVLTLEERRRQSEAAKKASQTPEGLEKRRRQSEQDKLRHEEMRRKQSEGAKSGDVTPKVAEILRTRSEGDKWAGLAPEEAERRRKQSERSRRQHEERVKRGERDMAKAIRTGPAQTAALSAPQTADLRRSQQVDLPPPQPVMQTPHTLEPPAPPATMERDWNAPSVLRMPKPVIRITAPQALQECYASDTTFASSNDLEQTLAAFDLPAPRVVTRAEAEFRVPCTRPGAGSPNGPPLNWVFGARVPHAKHSDELVAAWDALKVVKDSSSYDTFPPSGAHYYGFCKCATPHPTFFSDGPTPPESLGAAWHKSALLSIKNILVGQDPVASAAAGRIQQWRRRRDNDLRGHPPASRFLLNAGLGTGVEITDHLGVPNRGYEDMAMGAHRGMTDMTLHLPPARHDASTYTVLVVFGGAESLGVLVFPQLNLEIELCGGMSATKGRGLTAGTRVFFQASRLAYYIQPPEVQPRGLYVTAFSCAAATAHWRALEAAEAEKAERPEVESAPHANAVAQEAAEAHSEPAAQSATPEREVSEVITLAKAPPANETAEALALARSEADEAEDVDHVLGSGSRDAHSSFEEGTQLVEDRARLPMGLPPTDEEIHPPTPGDASEPHLLHGAGLGARRAATPPTGESLAAPKWDDRVFQDGGHDNSISNGAAGPEQTEANGRCDDEDIDMDVADMAAWLLGPDL